QTLEAADGPAALAYAFLAQLVQNRIQLGLIQAIELARRALAGCGNVHAEQGRARHINMASLDQLREMAEEQREQQHLNVGTVHVGIGQDADAPIAQPGKIGVIVRPVWVYPYGYRDVMNLGVGEETVAVDFPGA